MANSSYLTPNWLMSQINQLLQTDRKGVERGFGNALSKADFMDKYYEGESNPFFGDRNKHWFSDWSSDIEGYTGGMDSRGIGDMNNQMFNFKDEVIDKHYYYDKNEVYSKYLDAFKEVGGPTSYGQQVGNIFDPASFLGGVERAQGIGPENAHSPEMFTRFTPDMFKKLRTENYQDEITEEKGSLVDSLWANRNKASSMGGGFAGYGGREKAYDTLGTEYTEGAKGIYADVDQKKAQGLQDIFDVMSQYENLAG